MKFLHKQWMKNQGVLSRQELGQLAQLLTIVGNDPAEEVTVNAHVLHTAGRLLAEVSKWRSSLVNRTARELADKHYTAYGIRAISLDELEVDGNLSEDDLQYVIGLPIYDANKDANEPLLHYHNFLAAVAYRVGEIYQQDAP